jgi:5-methylcytosine-specific restriction endonuclease McrA
MVPTTRQIAQQEDAVAYFTGMACRNEHVTKRYTKTGKCYSCVREQAQRDYSKHKGRFSDTSKRYRERNLDRVLAKTVEWQRSNPDKVKIIRQRYHKSQYQNNRENPTWRLNRAMGHAVWKGLKQLKGHKHWECLVTFTLEELVSRLETMFQPGMDWSNYGPYWEVDHIKPLSKCGSFTEAWTLTNLQPLTRPDNRSKGNKYKGNHGKSENSS